MDLATALADDLSGAFPAFVDEFGGPVYSLALRLCGPDDAEDIAQEAFVKAFTALRTYGPERIADLCLRPWVVTIALNVARNRRRTLARRPEAPLASHDVPATATPTTASDLRTTLAASLLQLPLAQRQAVVLRHVLDCTTAEVASILERPEGTVKAQVARGLTALRTILTDQEERP